jgi:hypothetical protein
MGRNRGVGASPGRRSRFSSPARVFGCGVRTENDDENDSRNEGERGALSLIGITGVATASESVSASLGSQEAKQDALLTHWEGSSGSSRSSTIVLNIVLVVVLVLVLDFRGASDKPSHSAVGSIDAVFFARPRFQLRRSENENDDDGTRTILARKNHAKAGATRSLRARKLLNRRCASV